MPIKKDWNFLSSFNSKIEVTSFLDSQISTANRRSQPVNCTLCENNVDNHRMNYKIFKCNSDTCNSDGSCLFQYRLLECTDVSKNERSHLASLNEHLNEEAPLGKKAYGISPKTKENIENLIEEKNMFHPYKLKSALISQDRDVCFSEEVSISQV